jgi:hypothetical protein
VPAAAAAPSPAMNERRLGSSCMAFPHRAGITPGVSQYIKFRHSPGARRDRDGPPFAFCRQ